jgi:hypothetical protein
MPKADRVNITPRTTASEFLTTVNHLQISLMIRDPFVAAAFKAAEDDGHPGPELSPMLRREPVQSATGTPNDSLLEGLGDQQGDRVFLGWEVR